MDNDKVAQIDKTKPLFIEISLNVNTYDIDVAGHVNNIVYIRWLEDMRSLLFSKIFSLKKLLEVNHYIVVVSSEVKYRKQIKLFDKPIGKMLLLSYSHGVLLFKTEITIDNYIAFNATQKCVLMDLKNNKMLKGDINDFAKFL
jgi:acyl-CoA thioester hydrolase